ncbi:hypothetical protein [Priestia megaterium]|uniref:Uncharacterized protein n=1 Tax=Priestia megaterium TaxID=1404 RepID=A0A6M6E443_PRIMG|nr:hypothetical protein [Priestia megaterium]QJX79939.1 hypothetical protein FDZ14_27955 [Priestia megaterium]
MDYEKPNSISSTPAGKGVEKEIENVKKLRGKKKNNFKLIIETTVVAVLLLLISWAILKLSFNDFNGYIANKKNDEHTSGTYFGSVQKDNEVNGVSNKFERGADVYFSTSVKEPFNRRDVTLTLLNKYGEIESTQMKIKVPVKPESNYVYGVLDQLNDGKSSLEDGDYIFRVTNGNRVLSEGEFSVVENK